MIISLRQPKKTHTICAFLLIKIFQIVSYIMVTFSGNFFVSVSDPNLT